MSPWRPLTALAVIIVALGGTMVGTGYHSPKLGIDLAGGTSLTLTAKDSKGTPSASDMNTAVDIMRKRVNGYGVSEAEVTKQGGSTIQVDIPGNSKSSVLDQIGKTAQLYFRVVYNERANTAAPATTPTTSPSGTPSGTPTTAPSGTPTTKASGTPSASTTTKAATPSSSPTTQKKAVSDALLAATPSATPSASSGTASPTPSASTSATGTATPGSSATPAATPSAPTKASNGATRQTAPDAGTTALFNTINCAHPPIGSQYYDNAQPQNYSVGCSIDGSTVYLLGPSEVNGTDLTGASARQTTTAAGIVTGQWEIDLTLKDPGKTQFGTITGQLAANGGTFAVEVDGQVYSAATASQAIVDGNAMISGNFTQQTADDLANILSYGALPISFDAGDVQQISASLGGNQLSAGLLAGAIGLALVVLYLIFYYKALSFVAVCSLVIAAILTYAIATLLGPGMGFRLSLAGVAGLVVAIGITADSFVVFFERIRDEVREGRTLRTAVDHGWTRARRTIIAADFVSFLAAAVLYMVSVGTVQGFAFTLGLTTLIDVFVVFMFTKPVMTLLARTRFYNSGRKWSGLDPSVLGPKQGSGSGPRQTIADRRRAAADAEGMEA
jgi:preprotein translocase subunit SecD